MKGKINELQADGKNTNMRDLHRGINKFKNGCEPKNNLAKDDMGDHLPDSHSIFNM